MQPPTQASEPKVFISSRESKCDECGADLGHHAWITLRADKGALCLTCADLDHLAFLPAGDAALTRRSRKHSKLSAVVLKWSRARKRYERQGVLVESDALEKAEGECEDDSEHRELRREQAAIRRAELDQEYIRGFAARVRELYPHCPPGREPVIAAHACMKHSGRIGRTAAAKNLAEATVDLAVRAHIRHEETNYDQLLMRGCDRHTARERTDSAVRAILEEWRTANA